MYYNIIPLTKLPLTKNQEFTYKHDEQLSPGTLVKIDFAGKKLRGIVSKKTQFTPRFQIKSIEKVVVLQLLTVKQLSLAKNISKEYFSPLGVVLRFFVHNLTKKQSKQKLANKKKDVQLTLTKNQKQAIYSICNSKKVSSFLLFGPASCGKTEVIMGVIKEVLRQKRQILLLIPEIFLSHQEIARYTSRFEKNNVVLFHSGLKPSETSHVYNQVKDGSAEIIISTRMGLFLPFQNLGLIAVDEEQDVSFKQWDQSPHYHAREVSKYLARSHKAKLLMVSGTPSLESIQWSKNPYCKRIKLPMLKTNNIRVLPPKFIFSNLRIHHTKKQNAVITKELEKELARTIKQNGIAYILVPHRGQSKLVVCSDCKNILECPNCTMPLNNHGDEYRCFHCKFRSSSFAQCSKCGSFRLVNVGFGTRNVADLLKNRFPKAKIETADQDTFKNKRKRSFIMNSLLENKLDFLVGTYAIAKGLDIEHATLACVLNAENWSGKTEFRFDEHHMSNFFQLAGRVGRPPRNKRGVCLIQTYRPESEFWLFLKKWDWNKFAHQQLKNRKKLNYPPFQKLIKLTCKEDTKQKVEKNTKTVYNSFLKNKPSGVLEVYPPSWGIKQRNRRTWQKNILIKSNKHVSKSLRRTLAKLKSQWSIDIDPENVF
ncbi:MAG: primosomal protein N' [Patescibacteria group bacterium]|nr:primosomal protein N' [Patescibacteria group bacterium]